MGLCSVIGYSSSFGDWMPMWRVAVILVPRKVNTGRGPHAMSGWICSIFSSAPSFGLVSLTGIVISVPLNMNFELDEHYILTPGPITGTDHTAHVKQCSIRSVSPSIFTVLNCYSSSNFVSIL